MTINNFFQRAAEASANAADALKQRAMGAYSSLRGAAQTAAGGVADAFRTATGAPSADETLVRNAQNATAAGLERGPQGLRSTAASEAARAADPFGSSGPTSAQMLKSAANYTPRGLSGVAARAGRVAGPLSVLPEAYGAAKNVVAGENPMRSIGRASLRTGGAMLGGALGAAGGTLLLPGVGTAAGGVGGSMAGYQLADKAASYLFGPEGAKDRDTTQVAMADTKPAPNNGPDGPAPQPATLRTPDGASPEALLSGTGVPAEGTGAFKRTTPGNEGNAVAIGNTTSNSLAGASAQSESLRSGNGGAGPQPLGSNRSDAGYNQPSAVQGAPRDAAGRPSPAGAPAGSQSAQASSTGLRDVPTVNGTGLYAFKAGLRNAQLQTEARGQDATLASNLIQRQIQLAQLQHTLGNENEKRVNDQIDEFAKTRLPELSSGTIRNADKGAYDAQVAKKSAEIKSRFQYSIADRKDGKTVQQLAPAELQQLKDLEKVRDGVMNARSGTFQTLRDLFGQKRFDSENLYSYAPTAAEPSMQGGYLVHFGNGNTAHVKEVAGGKFVLFGANEPIDADTMKLIRPAIAAAQRKG